MSKVEVGFIGGKGDVQEVDLRHDSWHAVRLGILKETSDMAVDVLPYDDDMPSFRLKVNDRRDAVDVFTHPFGHLPGNIALGGAGVNLEGGIGY